jgi:hypothetical protein
MRWRVICRGNRCAGVIRYGRLNDGATAIDTDGIFDGDFPIRFQAQHCGG